MEIFDKKYKEIVIPKMMEKFSYKNKLQVPKINKITINVGIGDSQNNSKISETVAKTIKSITGQQPCYCLSKKAISGFKLRQGIKIGLKTTLRNNKMKDFFERLIHITLPRIRDFRGLSLNSFDGKGGYSIGIKEQNVFAEIDYDEIELTHGLEINITTSANSKQETKELLTLLEFPYKKDNIK